MDLEASAPSGRLKGRAVMNLTLDSLDLNDIARDVTAAIEEMQVRVQNSIQ